ncbi:Endo-1,4-beta-xylanase Z precursor [Rubripirellula lacrimiformis]|uniref:Endo-1,4-beta-xylanase Z n=1 Tax=Rubripirellula lacrimiformis TaxID=1930273 RepID=A0A517NEI0_9BACT|nr:alpha/beta hydrolase-fold protein [Rubripirellula lacrimiformis]QDT05537.1 Endo-1,4-beta-xylanase Z precursor [Rubripirellula lacrimiformis]
MRNSILIVALLLIPQQVSSQEKGAAAGRREVTRKREIQWVNPKIPDVKGLVHHVLPSGAMGHDVGYVVWTPPGLDGDAATRYPVIYFLHGAGGSEASDSAGFASRVAAAIRQDQFPPTICVFPNGGMSGYRGDVETMIVDELIPLIDAEYPTNRNPSGRAVAGFSMGGAGSVSLAIEHPGLFCAAGSWGGALSWRGSGEDSPLLPAAIDHADKLKRHGFALLTINGDQDRPDAFIPLAKTLQPLGITHKTVTLKDTNHNLGKYYELAGDTMIAFLAERFSAASDHQ